MCNIGNLLDRWSNRQFKSTLHQAVNGSGNSRYSIPVFFNPHTDTVINPVDLWVTEQDGVFEPVKAGEYIAGCNRKSFQQYK